MKVELKDKKSKQEKAYEVRKAEGAEIPVLGYWERAFNGEGLKRFLGESDIENGRWAQRFFELPKRIPRYLDLIEQSKNDP